MLTATRDTRFDLKLGPDSIQMTSLAYGYCFNSLKKSFKTAICYLWVQPVLKFLLLYHYIVSVSYKCQKKLPQATAKVSNSAIYAVTKAAAKLIQSCFQNQIAVQPINGYFYFYFFLFASLTSPFFFHVCFCFSRQKIYHLLIEARNLFFKNMFELRKCGCKPFLLIGNKDKRGEGRTTTFRVVVFFSFSLTFVVSGFGSPPSDGGINGSVFYYLCHDPSALFAYLYMSFLSFLFP